jgi:putative addiction module CopG family antidote
MRSTQQLSVTLPNEMAAEVRAKVASGDYASESEVIRDGLRALRARDKAVDHWLRNDVVPAYTALKADPSRGLALEDVRKGLAERHASQPAQTPKS